MDFVNKELATAFKRGYYIIENLPEDDFILIASGGVDYSFLVMSFIPLGGKYFLTVSPLFCAVHRF